MKSKSLFIIKPEAFSNRDAIRAIIDSSGFKVLKSVIKTIDAQEALEMAGIDFSYLHNRKLLAAYVHFLTRGEVEIGIIEKESCLEDFNSLCGTEPDPLKCPKGTLRNTFGLLAPESYGGQAFFLNGIHRSKNISEAEKEIAIFFNL